MPTFKMPKNCDKKLQYYMGGLIILTHCCGRGSYALQPSGGILRPSGDIMFGPWASYFLVHLWQGCDIVPFPPFHSVPPARPRIVSRATGKVFHEWTEPVREGATATIVCETVGGDPLPRDQDHH